MTSYQYRPLQDGHMRVMRLHPGDPLQIEIDHALLIAPKPQTSSRLSLAELAKTLPPDWAVYETLEKRYIFDPPEQVGDEATTWQHPDVSVPIGSYETCSAVQDPFIDVELQFEALSYRWVAEESHEDVLVLDRDSEARVLRIGSHLASMLRSLRLDACTRTLWIDAICINQNDGSEKSKQVIRMADVYMLARRVVIWLGGESHDSTLAMHSLQDLGQQVEYTTHCYFLSSPRCREPTWHDPSIPIPYSAATWTTISKLLSREWFERLWVWQEVHLANSKTVVQCGSTSISYYHFRTAILCLSAKLLTDSNLSTRLRFVASLVGVPPSSDYPLLWLIERTRAHKATDARDRIYALLGWAKYLNLAVVDLIDPDYALPVGRVFEQTIRAELSVSRSCNFLRMCTLAERKIDAPSWVPDLSCPPARMALDPYLLASSTSQAHVRVQSEAGKVEVWAVICGELDYVSPTFDELDPEGMGRLLWDTHRRVVARCGPGADSDAQQVSFIRSLTGGWTQDLWPELSQPCTVQACLGSFASNIASGERLTAATVVQDPFLARVSRHMNGRSVFQSGMRIGTGPAGCASCDRIAVILGCQTPIVLRAVNVKTNDTTHYQVVGECYVQGLMNGEAVLGELPAGWRCETRTREDTGRWTLSFSREETGVQTWKDPRSEDLEHDLEPAGLLARSVDLKQVILV